MRGLTIFEVVPGHIVSGRLCMEDAERDSPGIEDAVESLSAAAPGRPPGRASGAAPRNPTGRGEGTPTQSAHS
jgi:hypothetical protein